MRPIPVIPASRHTPGGAAPIGRVEDHRFAVGRPAGIGRRGRALPGAHRRWLPRILGLTALFASAWLADSAAAAVWRTGAGGQSYVLGWYPVAVNDDDSWSLDRFWSALRGRESADGGVRYRNIPIFVPLAQTRFEPPARRLIPVQGGPAPGYRPIAAPPAPPVQFYDPHAQGRALATASRSAGAGVWGAASAPAWGGGVAAPVRQAPAVFAVHLGTFRTREGLSAAERQARGDGLSTYRQPIQRAGESWMRLYAGPFGDQDQAEAVLRHLRDAWGVEGSLVTN